jgi:hypothetical protein
LLLECVKLQWQRGNQKCEIGATSLRDELHKTGFGYIWFLDTDRRDLKDVCPIIESGITKFRDNHAEQK